MSKIFLTACFIITATVTRLPLHAQQQHEVDSILNVLQEAPSDTSKVLSFYRLSYIYNYVQYKTELARKYVDSARQLSERLDYQKGIIESHYNYGMVDLNESNYPSALSHFNQYIDFYKSRGDSLNVGKALYCVGIVYNNLGETNKNLAIQLRALAIYERANDKSKISHTLSSIAGAYMKTGKYRDAILNYRKTLALHKELNAMRRYGMALQNLANVYVAMERYDSARYLYDEALKLVRVHNSKAELSFVLGNMAALYERLKNYKLALSYDLQALKIRRGQSQKRQLAVSLIGVGNLYFLNDEYSNAEKHLNEGLLIAQEIKAKDLLQECYGELSKVAAAKNDFKKAYEFNKTSQQWKDSLINEKSMAQINELQEKYEVSEKDKQITVLAKEKQIQAQEVRRQSLLAKVFIGGFIVVLLLVALVVYVARERIKNQKALTAKNEEIKRLDFKREVSELEMKALRAQINPHFLFNCMNSINRMILAGETQNASVYLTKFSKLVRLILENTERTNVSLDNELTLIESYIELEALRFKEKIGYTIAVDESIEKESTYLPSMVLQPFVENAIWHGLMHKEKNQRGFINIAIKEQDDKLLCTIEDNGVGRRVAQELKANSIMKGKSLGIKITEERLRLLSKERFDKLVQITDLKDALDNALGTRVEVHIPIVQ